MKIRRSVKWQLVVVCAVAICGGVRARAAAAADITSEGANGSRTGARPVTRVEELWPAGVHVSLGDRCPRRQAGEDRGQAHALQRVCGGDREEARRLHPETAGARPDPPRQRAVRLARRRGRTRATAGSPVDGARTAQEFANRGWLVVATYRNHHDDKPGHIAIVRPSNKSGARDQRGGPQITAGGRNELHQRDAQAGIRWPSRGVVSTRRCATLRIRSTGPKHREASGAGPVCSWSPQNDAGEGAPFAAGPDRQRRGAPPRAA